MIVIRWTILALAAITYADGNGSNHVLFRKEVGKYMGNSVIRVLYTNNEFECGAACSKQSGCFSVNYKYTGLNRGRCELNDKSFKLCPSTKCWKNREYIYLGIITMKQTYGSKCNPGKSCDYLQELVHSKSGEYWIIHNYQILKVYCMYENTAFNLALGKPTQQSSNYRETYTSDKAVDGNKNTGMLSGSCTHTRHEDSPWLRIDLEALYYIRRVDVTNRGDCCGDRISGFEIRIGISLDDNGNANPVCGVKYTLAQGETRAFACTPRLLGKYVNIVILGKTATLHVCEVEVYA